MRFIEVAGLILIATGFACGTVLRVPEEYSTIQEALDGTISGDTVLVAVGVYEEALVGPPHRFVLLGDVVPDTGDYARPVVDPSVLPGSDTLACLRLSGSSRDVVIEEMTFRNGPEMLDSLWRPTGGIVNNSYNLTLRRCRFASTHIGVSGGTRLNLAACRFESSRTLCARTESGPILAVDCHFSCQGGWNVSARDGSHFQRCVFRDNMRGELLVAAYDSIVVEDCVFGPWGPLHFDVVSILARAGCVFRNNVFTDCALGKALLNVGTFCPNQSPLPIVISGNTFRNYQGGEAQGGLALASLCQEGNTHSYLGVIEDNVFMDGVSTGTTANGLDVAGTADVRRNRFTRLDPPTTPDARAFRVDAEVVDTLTLRDNRFDGDGLAAAGSHAHLDARWNWWGDSTGPFHSVFNPSGEGGEVGIHVDFAPWHVDSVFDVAAREPEVPLPAEATLEAYPNPFNASVTLRLSTRAATVYRLELFDVLGRQVATVWSGAVGGTKELRFTTDPTLASGIYFVRVWQPIQNRPVALAKLVLVR